MIDPPPPVTGTGRNPTKADVEALYRRLVHSYGPPVTSASVFAQAVAAAMWEALEIAETAQDCLSRPQMGGPSLSAARKMLHEGELYAANKIMRAVYDSLNPGKGCSVGLRLATRRAVCGLTQRKVAEGVPLNRAHLTRLEWDERTLRPEDAVRIAEQLGCTPEYLLTGEGGRP